MEQVVYAGGTAGLIAFLMFVVYQLGNGNWQPKSAMDACEKRSTEANTRTDTALKAGDVAIDSVKLLTEELKAYRAMVERLLSERHEQSGGV